MWKFPLSIPGNRRIEITQQFKSKELVSYYKSKGLNISEHNAIDVTCGDSVATFGTPFVCPWPMARLVPGNLVHADPISGRSGRIIIEYAHDDDVFLLGGIHLSGVVQQQFYKEGDILGYIGNYGYVLPEPTIAQPFAGSHIHMTLTRNGVVVDPLLYFDTKNPFRSSDTGWIRDIPAIQWAIKKIQDAIAALKK